MSESNARNHGPRVRSSYLVGAAGNVTASEYDYDKARCSMTRLGNDQQQAVSADNVSQRTVTNTPDDHMLSVAEFIDTRRYREVELSSVDGRNWLVRDVVSGRFVGGGMNAFSEHERAAWFAARMNAWDAGK